MWKTERKRWDPSSSIPGTNDVGKHRELCIFFTQGSHFQTTYVALGCMMLPHFPVCTGFRGGVPSSPDRFECFSRRHWRSFTSHLAGQVFMRQRKVLSCFSICEPVVIVISIVLEVNLTSPLVMGEHTADIKQLVWQRLFLWDFTPENVREKSWLALFQWTNHQIEV